MKQIQLGIIAFLILLFTACTGQEELTFEHYAFEIKGFDWDPDPYKFSSYIQDSVVQTKGAQLSAWDFSYIGDIENALKSWDIESSPKEALSKEEISAFEKFERRNATEIIMDKAAETSITIINEAHHSPQHRVFTTSLLQDLYDLGYRHLGMESIIASRITDSTLLANQYPMLTNGYYIKEPQFGNIVRQALKIGYTIFGYESQGDGNSKEREINQAENIAAYIESNPEGKYLIHCGFAHGTEGIYGGSWEKAMAARLTDITNINPLTINQTTYSEKSKRSFENPYYQLTDVTEPSVFIWEDSIFGQYRENSWFDISVFHPRTKNFDRPAWLLTGNRTVKKIDFSLAEIACPCLVLAYKEGEEVGSAIPYDVKETASKEVYLVLDHDKYNIIIWNETREALLTTIQH